MWQGVISFALLEGLVVVQALLASNDQFLTVAQMRNHGTEQGLPFVWHLGMWGDFFVISFLVAVIVALHGSEWRAKDIEIAAAISTMVTLVMGYIYTRSSTHEAHMHEHQITAAGWVHLVYMAVAVSTFILFYFYTSRPSGALLITTNIAIVFQIFIGNHMVLGIFKFMGGLPWYPDQPLHSFVGWATIGLLAVGLGWRTNQLLS